jgi:hypothetical protein
VLSKLALSTMCAFPVHAAFSSVQVVGDTVVGAAVVVAGASVVVGAVVHVGGPPVHWSLFAGKGHKKWFEFCPVLASSSL